MVNAVAFQTSSIPRSFLGDPAPAKQAQGAPQPPARPAELAATPPAAVPAPAPQRQAAAQPATAAAQPAPATPRAQPASRESQRQAAAPAASTDPLGDLIRSQTGGAPARLDPVEPVRPPAMVVDRTASTQPARPVLPAQQALNRLGFGPVTADGRMGEQTRQAIERFERDRRLPVTRDLSPRTLRELAAASGMRIE